MYFQKTSSIYENLVAQCCRWKVRLCLFFTAHVCWWMTGCDLGTKRWIRSHDWRLTHLIILTATIVGVWSFKVFFLRTLLAITPLKTAASPEKTSAKGERSSQSQTNFGFYIRHHVFFSIKKMPIGMAMWFERRRLGVCVEFLMTEFITENQDASEWWVSKFAYLLASAPPFFRASYSYVTFPGGCVEHLSPQHTWRTKDASFLIHISRVDLSLGLRQLPGAIIAMLKCHYRCQVTNSQVH